MAISFNQVPSTLLTPFMAIELDNSRAIQGPSVLNYRALLMGQRRSTGTATAGQLLRVTSPDQVATYAGRGSMLHRQAIAHFKNNSTTETWIAVLDDNAGGVAATGTITLTGPATAAGTLALYLGGSLVTVAVASGDAATAVAAAINTAINAATDLPVTSTVSTNVVTVSFRHKGLVGNEFDMRLNYQGETTPAGIGVTIVQLASGTLNPVLTTMIANMGDSWFQTIAHPYTDSTSLTALETELASRSGPLRQCEGLAITAKSDSYANVATLGLGRNSQFTAILRTNDSPTPPMEYAAAVAGVVAAAANTDPARPFQTLALTGVCPPAELQQDTLQMRNVLLIDGISTTKVVAGVVQIERLVTTYKTNAAGSPDVSYRDANTVFTLMYLRFTFRARITNRYPRHKLANDGTRFGAGQAIITPSIGKAEAILWFREMEELGLVENFDQFKSSLVCERDATDANRLNWLLPPDLVNQFVVGATKLQFRL